MEFAESVHNYLSLVIGQFQNFKKLAGSVNNPFIIFRCSTAPWLFHRSLDVERLVSNRSASHTTKMATASFFAGPAHALQADDKHTSSFNELRVAAADALADDVPVEMHVHAATALLQNLKLQLVALRTKELFLTRVAAAQVVNAAFPTSQQLAEKELALGKAKTDLRATKAAVRDAERILVPTAVDVAISAADRDQTKHQLLHDMDAVTAALHLQRVDRVLDSGDSAELHRLVEGVDELGGMTCRTILGTMQKRRDALREHVDERTKHMEVQSSTAAHARDGLQTAKDNLARLNAEVEKNERVHAGAGAVRHECMMQEQLGEAMSALTGVRVVHAQENRAVFHINARIFKRGGFQRECSNERLPPTRTLELKLTSRLNDILVSGVSLDPWDVELSPADTWKDEPVPLLAAIRFVCACLRE